MNGFYPGGGRVSVCDWKKGLNSIRPALSTEDMLVKVKYKWVQSKMFRAITRDADRILAIVILS